MKSRFIIALLLAPAFVSAAEPSVSKDSRPALLSNQAPRAWLGVDVSKPDQSITAHLPTLPQGVGFVVNSLDSGGPAEVAGLRAFDLLWKFGDQMLINEAQLATLLRLSKPGQEVVISGFRGGKPLEVKLTLGDAPVRSRAYGGEFAEAAILPGACSGPMRVVNLFEKSASFTTDEGTATVHRDGEVYKIKIVDSDGKSIFGGDLSKDHGLDQIPEGWRRKIQVLCRSLDHALDGSMMSGRQPRPRVNPPSLSNP